MSIENLVLSRDHRGVSALRPFLADDFCGRAAALILDNPGTAIIATGFYVPAACATETDGPPGAVAMGDALAWLGYRVVYVSDRFTTPLLCGLLGQAAEIVEWPVTGHTESREFAAALIERVAPTVSIAIERCGLTDEGLYRNMRGVDVSPFNAKLDYLFSPDRASVGIGDGGNEIGMGNLANVIPEVMPIDSPPCVTKTTRLVISSVSNWGAWGVVAAMSRLRGRNLLPTVDEAHDLLRRAVAMGAVDGVSRRNRESVDGFPIEENDRLLSEMHDWLARHHVGVR
ncbi:MAG TPA: glutamate cyclase domain-containing protein [Vicinamibacterales bacterium]|jgi:hypothetical protein